MKIRGNLFRMLFGINLLFFIYCICSPLAYGTGRWYYSFQITRYQIEGEDLLISWNFWFNPDSRVLLRDYWFSGDMYYYGFTYELISTFVFQLLTVFSGIWVMTRRWQKTTSMLVPNAFSISSVLVGLLLVARLDSILYATFVWGLPFAMFSTLFFWLLFSFRYALERRKRKRAL